MALSDNHVISQSLLFDKDGNPVVVDGNGSLQILIKSEDGETSKLLDLGGFKPLMTHDDRVVDLLEELLHEIQQLKNTVALAFDLQGESFEEDT